ncbi:MAG: DUF1570 domain-containing protein [Pirellula sp.]|jgi:hypothetical protein|nr:DUF1570 domain-containing protein [Pirellula sp.]
MTARVSNPWLKILTGATLGLGMTGCGQLVPLGGPPSNQEALADHGIRVSNENAVIKDVESHGTAPLASRLEVKPEPSRPGPEEDLVSSTPQPSDSGRVQTTVPRNAGRPPMLAVRLPTGKLEGLPIGLFSDKMLLMRTNGSIDFLDNRDILSHRVTNLPFETQDLRTLTSELQSEFGREYRVRSALPYLVIAKPDRIGVWCDQFHRFHDSIRLFCTTNSIPLRTPEFPLVAVVFETRREFEHYAKLDQADLPPTCVGYYSQKTNRIVLYENTKSKGNHSTLQTICHEATHQLAFNAGMHQRLAETPVWVAEGFAVQFEAPAYCDYASRDGASHWPSSQRQGWVELKRDRQRFRRLIQEMIGSDEPFKTDTLNAYTAAWALNSYLSQRRSRQYVDYMRRIGSLKPFVEYSHGDRMRDFIAAFGPDIGILIRETIQHVERLP